ncbi:MAG: mechanosensitive ion channel family protein [Gammaproteobacteria bacterium]|jgi:MscS family membrane protein
MELMSQVKSLIAYLRADSWIIQVFVVVFLALVFDWIQKRLVNRLYEKLKNTHNYWDDALVDAMRVPLSALIWLIGLTFAADIVRHRTEAFIFEAVEPLRDVGVIAIITWFLVRFIKRAEDNVVRGNVIKDASYDRTTADAIAKLLRLSVIITAALVMLQTLGYSISGVLAFGGVSGIAVGFAARDLLANFFGGFVVYMDRPFVVGEWIRSPDKEIEGTVEEIGWRVTRIRTFDKRPLYVPNSLFTTISVENPSRMTNRRIYETVGIRYDDAGKMGTIVEDVREMLNNHPEIDTGQTLIVNFTAFAASSLNFFVYAFTKTREWVRYHEIKQDVLLKIIDIIEKHGAECAFPTTTVHIPEGLAMSQSGQANKN